MRTVIYIITLSIFIAPAQAETDRAELYHELGMDYAVKLHQKLDGSAEDEARSRGADHLNYKVREKAIRETEAVLAKRRDPALRRDLLKRLATLHQQQATVAQRRATLPNREQLVKQHLHTAIKNLGKIRAQFPGWKPDIILFEIAESHAALGDFQKSEKYYYEVIKRFSRSPILADALLAMGNLQFEKQRFTMAREFYGKIFRTPDKNLHPYAHYKIAWAFFNETNLNSAVAALEAAVLESRKLQAENGGNRRLGVEDEALSDMVLFFAEAGKTKEAEATFQRLVDEKRAKELRFNLAKRLFEYGKHSLAKNVANDLLNDNPLEDQTNKLYLIVISSAEQSGERETGLNTAQKLSGWLKERNLASTDTGRIETEEYLRRYSQKLHYEAETLKRKETWNHAEKSYEIYLDTFDSDSEVPEVKFRYAVLLMHQKSHIKAYKNISAVIAAVTPEHKRFQESLKLRIQSIELATKSERKEIGEKNLLVAYDEYVKHFPADKLATEAEFKAANLAKTVEGPEAAAARFRGIAERNPAHSLAKSAVDAALAVLVKAERWESLHLEAKALQNSEKLKTELLPKHADLSKKIKEAEELALVKIAENQEKSGQYAEAVNTYRGYAATSEYPDKIRLHSLIRATEIAEQKLSDLNLAAEFLEKLREQYPSSKEGAGANIELARLAEKMGDPERAANHYLAYAGEAKTTKEIAALTNAAAIYEGLGDAETAAGLFFRLHSVHSAKGASDAAADFFEAGCNNVLLAVHGNRSEKTLGKIMECADRLSRGVNGHRWIARKAWAEELLKKDAASTWTTVAKFLGNSKNEADRVLLAQSRLVSLSDQFKKFAGIRFSATNEKPAANIAKKNQALETFERSVKSMLKIGTKKQIISAQEMLKQAYLDFAETMESAAMPKKLSEAEQSELKKSFLEFADGFRKKAEEFAKTVDAAADRAPATEAEPQFEGVEFAGLEAEEETKILEAISKKASTPSIYARYASHRFQKGDYREARYYFTQWKKFSANGKVKQDEMQLMDALQAELGKKIPDGDPMLQDLL